MQKFAILPINKLQPTVLRPPLRIYTMMINLGAKGTVRVNSYIESDIVTVFSLEQKQRFSTGEPFLV